MQEYVVEVLRTERIYFQLSATSADDAEARYLEDGDEIGSKSVGDTPEVVSVTLAAD
jgi:hypothetical protein